MSEEEKESIKNLTKLVELRKNKAGEIKHDTCICSTRELETILNLIQNKQKEMEKKEKLEKEVADDIDRVAIELNKLSNNIFIVNEAMKLQKIAEEKLGKFYID